VPEVTALETSFPANMVNAAAEAESWRKEVHRPATHTHKWWAQRLGTVFRGLLISSLTANDDLAEKAFASAFRAPGIVVFDPFAGSGTTLVEALKLGCKVIGQDINPVATLVQRQAVSSWDQDMLDEAFAEIERIARPDIDDIHQAGNGEPVLYYFWVARARCPSCPPDAPAVDLFSSHIFAKHAYLRKNPKAQAICPNCGSVVRVHAVVDKYLNCGQCGQERLLDGPVSGAWMTCGFGHRSKILSALAGNRPGYRMYAKLVLGQDGSKRYEGIDEFDVDLYDKASKLLAAHSGELVLPAGILAGGHNTRQAMSWGFHAWEDFFNDRQLYSLGLIGAAIMGLPASPEREALAALFSGALEFNNLFCSFKGEGTGAVRHMFSHHILKPERMPLEAHPWGTPSSSGSFSTLYKSRILRALDYKLAPHDIVGGRRMFGLSAPLTAPIFTDASDLLNHDGPAAMLITGSSALVALPDHSVDIILTDPPFFDNVHYSELADFFHAWLAPLKPHESYPAELATTRSNGEVQHTHADEFGTAIAAVWQECARILKPEGLLVFTFHQSKPSGWLALVKALRSASLVVTAVQPVKAEMSTASPKSGASDPSNLDAVVVCRHHRGAVSPTVERAVQLLKECRDSGVAVGFSDVQSVVRGTVLTRFTWDTSVELCSLAEEAARAANDACRRLGINSARR
jgi:putative DNA methylase